MVKNSFLEGIKFSLGILFIFSILSFGYAVGFHYPNEILPGTFSTGNYVFDGDLSVNDDFDVGTYSLDIGSTSSGDHNTDGYADFEAGRVSSAYGTKFVGSASLMLEEYDDPFLLVGRQTKFQTREDTVLSFYRKKLGLGINLPQYTFDVNGTQRISTNNSVDYDEPALLLDLRGHAGYPGDDLALKIMMDGDGDVNRNGFFDVGNDDVAIEVLSRVDPLDNFSIAYRLWSDGDMFVKEHIGVGMSKNQFARLSLKSNGTVAHSIYSEADMEIVSHNSGNDIEFGFIDKNSGVVSNRAVRINNDGTMYVNSNVYSNNKILATQEYVDSNSGSVSCAWGSGSRALTSLTEDWTGCIYSSTLTVTCASNEVTSVSFSGPTEVSCSG